MEMVQTLDNINIPMVLMLTISIIFLALLQILFRQPDEALEVTQVHFVRTIL